MCCFKDLCLSFPFLLVIVLSVFWFTASHYHFGIFNIILEQSYHLFDLQIQIDIPFIYHITVCHTQLSNNEFHGIAKKNWLLLVKKYKIKCYLFLNWFFLYFLCKVCICVFFLQSYFLNIFTELVYKILNILYIWGKLNEQSCQACESCVCFPDIWVDAQMPYLLYIHSIARLMVNANSSSILAITSLHFTMIIILCVIHM